MAAVTNKVFLFFLALALLLISGFSLSKAAPPPTSAKIVTGFFSNALSFLVKWLWSLKATSKTAITGRPMMKFESGYTVETVFDGSKLGLEPYSVEVLPNGELLILDSANSNLYKISSSLSQYTRPKLIAGSADGYSGHVDGKTREARMNHPKGLTVDDRGNIYIADTMNMAIRKISDSGVTTIAGGKVGRGAGHVDGPSEDAKFSNDFDVFYIGSSCSLLVIDRGNHAIREIQLHFDDCAYQYGSSFPLGIAVLLAAGFFGYMLALLQRRVGGIVSKQSKYESSTMIGKTSIPQSPYQKPFLKPSIRPPLIPTEDELQPEKQDDGFFASLGRLLINTGTSVSEILEGIFPGGFRKKSVKFEYQSQNHQVTMPMHSNENWAVQQPDSFVIPDEDEPPPPSIETRAPTPRKTYAFMSKDAEKMQQLRQSRVFYSGWDGEFQNQQQQQQQHQQQQHHHLYHSSTPKTYYEKNKEETEEIVFGAVQEQNGRFEDMVIRPLDHWTPTYGNHKVRSQRVKSSVGYY
ncbi:uncharacterized protein LOC124925847 isoform X2 [Impatiens glandulifera]|uniref:uncharacterized protein LOC124925847 isoform X2 n=1 Tax=Impatiens glandulifera TaxID=253017 RepID=UPI001FB161D2|nr:uncharacterized protein LOC124925847 isoform X2 [Impatiens glandulifera]